MEREIPKTQKSLECLLDRCYPCNIAPRGWCEDHGKPGAGEASLPKHCEVCGDFIYDAVRGK